MRRLTPRFVPDRHVWLIALALLFVVWFLAGTRKLALCEAEEGISPLCGRMVHVSEAPDGSR